MSELSKIIGNNIKALRQGKQLTQQDIAGDEITRNMISLIESGNANPSLKTLEYLSNKLEVPIGYFFINDEVQSSEQIKHEIIANIRDLYSSKQYTKCLELCHSISIMDDEIYYVISKCEIELAKEYCKKFYLTSALEHFSLAQMAAEYSIYNSAEISQTVTFYTRLIETVEDENVSPLLTQLNQYSQTNINIEYLIFLNQLKTLEDTNDNTIDFKQNLESPIYSNFILAKRFLIKKDYISAIPFLKNVFNNPDTNFYIFYKACSYLEMCSQTLDDYKSAYFYSKKKLEMIDKFKK